MIASDSYFDRLAARVASLAGSISQSLSSIVSGSRGSADGAGTRLQTELLLSNRDPAGDDGAGGDAISTSQPGARSVSVLTALMDSLGLSIGQVSSSGLSGSFDASNPPRGMPPASRFVEAYPLVYTINGLSPPPPGFVMGRMVPDPLPLRKYYSSCNSILNVLPHGCNGVRNKKLTF